MLKTKPPVSHPCCHVGPESSGVVPVETASCSFFLLVGRIHSRQFHRCVCICPSNFFSEPALVSILRSTSVAVLQSTLAIWPTSSATPSCPVKRLRILNTAVSPAAVTQIMPYLRKDAPAHIPEGELIESLLGKKCDNFIKPLQKLTDEERKRTNIVQIGKRNADIDGDPYGVWASWSGNVYHPKDKRMVRIRPISPPPAKQPKALRIGD